MCIPGRADPATIPTEFFVAIVKPASLCVRGVQSVTTWSASESAR